MRTSAIVAVLLAALGTTSAQAFTTFSAQVTNVGTYGNGDIFIFLTTSLSEPGCTVGPRIDVSTSNPNTKQILALAMSAMTSGLPVTGAVNGCDPSTGFPTFDQTHSSYIFLDQ